MEINKGIEQKALDELRTIWCEFLEDDDNANLHIDADDVLVKLLVQLGYTKVVDTYIKMRKRFWYS